MWAGPSALLTSHLPHTILPAPYALVAHSKLPLCVQIRSTLRTQLASLQPVELVLPPPLTATGTGTGTTMGTAAAGGAEAAEGAPPSEATASALAAAAPPGLVARNITRGGREAWTAAGAEKVGEREGRGEAVTVVGSIGVRAVWAKRGWVHRQFLSRDSAQASFPVRPVNCHEQMHPYLLRAPQVPTVTPCTPPPPPLSCWSRAPTSPPWRGGISLPPSLPCWAPPACPEAAVAAAGVAAAGGACLLHCVRWAAWRSSCARGCWIVQCCPLHASSSCRGLAPG